MAQPKPRRALKLLRVGKDLTQRDLSLRAKLSQNSYWEIENGYRAPTEAQQAAIAKALGATAAEAFPDMVAS